MAAYKDEERGRWYVSFPDLRTVIMNIIEYIT